MGMKRRPANFPRTRQTRTSRSRDGKRVDNTPDSADKKGALKLPPSTDLAKRGRGDTRGSYEITTAGLEAIQLLAADGHPQVSIARVLGMDRATFRSLRKRDPRVDEAVAAGFAANEVELVNLLMSAARAGDVTAMIFQVKARHGWREGTERNPQGVVNNIVIALPGAKSIDDWVPPTIDVPGNEQ